jgi:hypothetical protein
MGVADFDHLLRDCRTAFGSNAWPERTPPAVAEPIRGRLRIDPFTVPLAPSENALSVTQTWFFYDARFDLPANVMPPRQHDYLTINGVRYEVIDVQNDDLGESGLQLLRAPQSRVPVVWDDGATTWHDDGQSVVWVA